MKNSIFFIALLLLGKVSTAQQPDSVRNFIDSALNLMQRHSLFSAKVNWPELREKVAQLSAHARSYREAEPSIEYAFNQLGDKHGWLVLNGRQYRNPAFEQQPDRLSANIKEAALKGPAIYAGVVAGQYAYISVPFFGGQDTTSMNRFAQRIQDSLCSGITNQTKGIILDLRLNAGGNVYPMIVGLSNVYGEEKKNDGKEYAGDWNIQDHGIYITETFNVKLRRNCGDLSRLPVAVIVGPVTGSSGEFLAIAFSTRENTILIGEPTAGYTTANNGFVLPGQNNGIVLSESIAVDKNGREYPDGIIPAMVVEGDDFFNREQDQKIRAAVKWLDRQRKGGK